MLTKYELYQYLCVEAGTYTGSDGMSARDWWIECGHNLTLDEILLLTQAASGEAWALAEIRENMGLPIQVCPMK